MIEQNEPIDVEVIEETHEPAQTMAVATQPTHVLRPMTTPEEASEVMAEYQRTVRAVLDESDYQTAERGKKFVKKSGWRKIAKAYGLSLEVITSTVERDDDGHPVRAEVWIRAIAPNGQRQDADGYCSVDESRFKNGGGRQKLENDLRATATTRAKNRAISDLVGMGEVSAEEIVADFDSLPAVKAYAGDLERIIGDAGVTLLGLGDVDAPVLEAFLTDVGKLVGWLEVKGGGSVTEPVGEALEVALRMLAKNRK